MTRKADASSHRAAAGGSRRVAASGKVRLVSTPGPSFDNSYARLPELFSARLNPTPVPAPKLIRANDGLADRLGIDRGWLHSEPALAVFSGNQVPPGAEPIATVYAGHQFGSWNPKLGDGRALLLGELIGVDGIRYDIQLKGSGRTPYSRGGDGKAPLGPVLREYLISEAMAALGIPTSRSLAAVTTGESVFRESGPLPGAVLTRVAQSHIRIGTVQYFASLGNAGALRTLLEHVVRRHFPEALEAEEPFRAMLDTVIERQAELVARWMAVGFIHGVMNTDNMLLCGETIDYGPCAFIDGYDPATVYSSIDHGGRYAYGNQPRIAHWNLAQLAQAMLPLFGDDHDRAVASAQAAVDTFPERFLSAHRRAMLAKLGIGSFRDGDEGLIEDLLVTMASEKTDFTLGFRRLTELADPAGEASAGSIFDFSETFVPWLQRWRERLELEPGSPGQRRARMETVNPVFLPRNHLVEEVISAAYDGDFQPFHDLVDVLGDPCRYRLDTARYAHPPRPDQVVRQTFCGT